MERTRKLINEIRSAFAGVQLGDGVSWREAPIIDDYGSDQERAAVRKLDEKENWENIPLDLIIDLRYQSVLSFLDAEGLRFYLPVCMIHYIEGDDSSGSAVVASLPSQLASRETSKELIPLLSKDQIACVRSFLQSHVEGSGYSPKREAIRQSIKDHWT
ncbi:DUF6714 family protein [Flavilitoribacter nigricans]|uniref:Uncharacterized protein n=1 Tax=Flavilitoribacter nigricans (strain ATCC 23147 / DSM 23189 / NBRC 102662 / NCIMB 1420 / SS-2) TaxID=1122177 RepID=A0A2D0MYK7_FLAN2|nr:DUF6714 family protein [Flavilitoribacter nigricans]PHN01372.1 hypothetical protein CRP01_37540 [Flavilitoribacter nigricans DSM 23189 = NBRC 102662]